MNESGNEQEEKPGSKVAYLKERVQPIIQEAHNDLTEHGLNPDDPNFKALRKKITRKYFDKERVGQIDPLTGLLSRAGYEKRKAEEISRAKREGTPLSAVIIDINYLKQVNDGPGGHAAGDELLKQTANAIKNISRIFDVIARYGGDEIFALLPNTNQIGALEYGQKVAQAFQEHKKAEKDGTSKPYPISAGIGVGQLDLKELDESFDLIDKAMYKAKKESKREGKNVVHSIDDLTTDEVLSLAHD